ncbi:bacteriocin immunity protein [Sphingobacterium detergens]|uniref:Colicin immunity protein/pyocin immunity protein n=1 Tax=Sphingobacterium detergens TaxID=1145106 RepID=A0A420ARM3_SPHD1|nr:bacteriocin immunity protein [Sphingobacterium detergens]RKE47118.1 colicin immunity protein/pyocin immunity protein [Sphingobacterium detergens]
MERKDLIELVEKIRNAEGVSEKENDDLIDQFLAHVPDPNAANYIFEKEYEDLSASEIVDRALAYKPFML